MVGKVTKGRFRGWCFPKRFPIVGFVKRGQHGGGHSIFKGGEKTKGAGNTRVKGGGDKTSGRSNTKGREPPLKKRHQKEGVSKKT